MTENFLIDTLCLITKANKILLGHKKRGFGKGYWNGFGGKVKANETLHEAAIREVWEECKVRCHQIHKRAVLEFHFPTQKIQSIQGHVFICESFSGQPQDTEEMKVSWFLKKEIPYQQMWADDILWMPHLLAGKKLDAVFYFDTDNQVQNYQMSFRQDSLDSSNI